MIDMVFKAIKFASLAHKDQLRKWTGESYIIHPIEVADIVSYFSTSKEILAAAILHDVVEDTEVTLEEIEAEFGYYVASLVDEVTKVSVATDGNRAIRKDIDRKHYMKASYEGQMIKLADVIANVIGIFKVAPDFAKIYLPEQKALVESLTNCNYFLRKRALTVINEEEHLLLELRKKQNVLTCCDDYLAEPTIRFIG